MRVCLYIKIIIITNIFNMWHQTFVFRDCSTHMRAVSKIIYTVYIIFGLVSKKGYTWRIESPSLQTQKKNWSHSVMFGKAPRFVTLTLQHNFRERYSMMLYLCAWLLKHLRNFVTNVSIVKIIFIIIKITIILKCIH